MKNIHKIIFVITLIIACFSAYSLAEVNIPQKINFEWYNGKAFSQNTRYFYGKWNSSKYPKYLDFDVITNNKIVSINGKNTIKNIPIPKVDFDNEFLIFATLGEVYSNGVDIKIKEISQHGNVVEVMTSLMSPNDQKKVPFDKQYVYDIIKINKDDLLIKGNILFIFKDSNGVELYRNYYNI